MNISGGFRMMHIDMLALTRILIGKMLHVPIYCDNILNLRPNTTVTVQIMLNLAKKFESLDYFLDY